MGISEKKYSYRVSPQVSASQIAEYLGATAPRRKAIIQAARFPKISVAAQYDRAREALVNFLADGTRSYNHLADATDALQRRLEKPNATDWLMRDSRYSLEAIEAFQSGYNKLGLPKLDCLRVHGRQPLLDLWPTKVSVALDLMVRKPNKAGAHDVGAIILLFSKGERRTKARVAQSKTIAGLIYTFCNKFHASLGSVDRTLCLAVDVFARTPYRPPGEFLRAIDQISVACEEIASRWDGIAPPSDYDGPGF